jgi:intraflagellar transport protein 88
MGNLYHIQEKFPKAIRMYRMALDQTSREEKDTRLKILRNIGNTFVKIGKLRDAIIAYEDAVGTSYDMKSCINLISCYVQLGDEEKSRQTLFRMISAAQKILGSTEEVEIEANVGRLEKESRDDLDKKRKETESILHTAARMVAKLNNESNWVDSFLWVHEQLHEKFPHVAFQIEIERAIEHLQKGEFAAAVKIFKSYENKDIEFKANVATNLSFVYFLEGNYITADEYADIALLSNKYNPNALVNKGNCLFIHEDYTRAREFYLEAIAIKSTCFEAIYNLALTNIRLGKTSEAMQSFVKLHTVSSNDPRVLQI